MDKELLIAELMKRFNDERYSMERRSCYFDLAEDIKRGRINFPSPSLREQPLREALSNIISAVESLAIQYKFPETYEAARTALAIPKEKSFSEWKNKELEKEYLEMKAVFDERDQLRVRVKELEHLETAALKLAAQNFKANLSPATALASEGDGWITVEDGLPEVDTPVEVITEYLNKGEPWSDRFIGYMDEFGQLVICPTDDDYGWQFNDCVTKWRNLPSPPQNSKI